MGNLKWDKVIEEVYDPTTGGIKTNAEVSGDINVNSSSVDTSGLVGKSSGGDFIVSYTSSTTLTVTGFSGTLTADDIVSIEQFSSSGSRTAKITRDDYTVTVSSNVITVSGASFTSSDTFVVYTNVSRFPIDSDLDIMKSIDQSPLWSRYTDSETLVSAQDLTSSYADYGSEIDVRGFTHIGVWVVADCNDSQDVTLKALAKTEYGGTDEFELDSGGSKTLWSGSGSDFKKYYEFDVSSIPYVQLQAYAGTVGTTAGDLTIYVTKIWRGH